MVRAKRDEFLRHETSDDEDGFVVPTRESGIVKSVPPPKRGKGKRSVEDMMASMPNELAQSTYALERIAAIEDQIAKVLALCTPEARRLVLKQRPSMKRYA